MDARPQRPLRGGVRVQTDENLATATQSKQTLHQRHKSTGALVNMLGGAGAGLKAAAKRTAFGDVSNTRPLSTIHDDSVIVDGKKGAEFVKSAVHVDKASLHQPAQRPLSLAKSSLNMSQANGVKVEGQLKGQLENVRPKTADTKSVPGPAPKRALSKRSTAIFKDAEANVENVAPQIANGTTITEVAPIAPVHQNLGGLRQPISQTQLKVEHQVIRRTQSKSLNTNAEQFLQGASIHEDVEVATTIEKFAPIEEEKVVEVYKHEERQLPLPPRSEPEEYWEDDEEEIYDEQGYTTAHSYRSRGDNTTGGATIVLAPKVTKKAEQELAAATAFIEATRSTDEIEDEAWDTSMVAEYGDEIFGYMRELEQKMLPNAHYMDLQTEIQWSMRSVLMDWLIQVHHRFSLLPETLFLTTNYIDRFLSCKIVSLGKLQLVGATAIFVAAKYEEINCPSVNEIVYMVDGGYTVDEILKAERFMLTMLNFELGWPGPMSFLRRISKADDYDLETRTLAKYFLEVTIMDERFVGSPPSYIAAGAHCFARMMLKKGDWSQAHVYYSGYTWTQLRPLVAMIMECCVNPTKHHGAVYEKYSDRRYKRASLYVQGEMQKGFVLPSNNSRSSIPYITDVAAPLPYETHDSFKRMVQVKG